MNAEGLIEELRSEKLQEVLCDEYTVGFNDAIDYIITKIAMKIDQENKDKCKSSQKSEYIFWQ